MNIRLSIDTGSGLPTAVEHAGPIIRIGRDSDCELPLQGEACSAVSRQHARIKLSADGATLADLGSRNGTLLNEVKLEGPAPLRVGDRIQLGFTGATLTVLALDLSATRPGKAGRLPRPLLIGSIAAAIVVFVSGVIVSQRLASEWTPTKVSPPVTSLVPDNPPSRDSGKGLPHKQEASKEETFEKKQGDLDDIGSDEIPVENSLPIPLEGQRLKDPAPVIPKPPPQEEKKEAVKIVESPVKPTRNGPEKPSENPPQEKKKITTSAPAAQYQGGVNNHGQSSWL